MKANVECDEEGGDEIIAQYDVFASQLLTGSLHIFQYPLRPMARPYEMSRVEMFVTKGVAAAASSSSAAAMTATAAASKPTETFDRNPGLVNPTSRMSLHIELDTFGSDSFRRRSDGDDPYAGTGDARTFSYQLESVPFQKRSEYAVGVIRDSEIHLTPVTAVQQFTPVAKPRASTSADDHISRVAAGNTTNVGGAVQSTLDRQLRRLRSVALSEDAANKEPWDFFPNTSVESKTVAQRLYSSTITASSQAQIGDRKRLDPVDAYFPRDASRDIGSTLRKHIVARYAENYAVAAQVEDLLRSCQAVHLPMLMAQVRGAGGGPPQLDEIVAALKRRAVYLHGLWIAAESGKYQLNEAAVREVVLLQFALSANGTVARRELNALFPRNPTVLPAVKRVLDDIAELPDHHDPAQRRWCLKWRGEAAKSAHIMAQQFADDVARQRRTWEARAEEVRSHVGIINSGKIVPQRNLRLVYFDGAPAAAGGAGLGGGGGQPLQASAKTPASAELEPRRREELLLAARDAIRRIFREHGVVNRQVAKEYLRVLTKRPVDRLFQCPDAVLIDALKAELLPFTDTTWILQRPENDLGSDCRRFLVVAMRQKPEFTLKDCVERATQLMRHELQTKGEAAANRTIDHPGASIVANELAEYHQGEKLWHVKSGMVKLA